MQKHFTIGVISHKGGVGKTTIAINLATALRMLDYSVLLIDGDTSNPSIGLSLGMEDVNVGYKELVTKASPIEGLASVHATTGLHAILGTLHTKPFVPTKSQMQRAAKKIGRCDYDFVIIDTSPGYYTDDVFGYWDEGLVVATPDMPAVTSVLRLQTPFKRAKVECSLVLNRVKGRKYELRQDEIQKVWGNRIVGALPEDDAVSASMAERIPVVLASKNSAFARSVRTLANRYARGRRGISRLFTFR